MKTILITLITIILVSCSNNEKIVYQLPSEKDINEIIETIILKDSIPIFINNAAPDTLEKKDGSKFIILPINNKFSIDLEKYRVFFPIQDTENIEIPPPPGMGVNFSSLVNFNYSDTTIYFAKSDSSYICFQNDTLNHFIYNGRLTKQINTTKTAKQKEKKESYYAITLPIFSTDRKKAYVEVTFRCWGLCGGATGYILVKKSGHWEIAIRRGLWIS